MNASKILYDKRTRTDVHDLPNGKVLAVKLRYDDDCKNGHNSFSITGTLWSSRRGYEANLRERNNERALEGLGCMHDTIMQYRGKQYGHLIRWHLVSDDGLMHYVENTLYHLGYRTGSDTWYAKEHRPNIDYARSSACWPDMPESYVCDLDKRMLKVTREAAAAPIKAELEARLPALMEEFHRNMATIEWQTVRVRGVMLPRMTKPVEVGKRYRTQRGDEWLIVSVDGPLAYPVTAERAVNGVQLTTCCFQPNGQYWADLRPDPTDLIEEVPNES